MQFRIRKVKETVFNWSKQKKEFSVYWIVERKVWVWWVKEKHISGDIFYTSYETLKFKSSESAKDWIQCCYKYSDIQIIDR